MFPSPTSDECEEGTALTSFDGTGYGAEYVSFIIGQRLWRFLETEEEGWAKGMVAHNDIKDVGWFPAAFWSARVEQDHSIAGQSIACREVVDLVFVVDCLMLSGSCAVLELLDHSWSNFFVGIYISKCLHGIDEVGQNVYSATPSVSAKLCTRTLSHSCYRCGEARRANWVLANASLAQVEGRGMVVL